jgi:hypothetical protein
MNEAMNEHYTLVVNGVEHEVQDSWIGESLLFVLRERLGLIGAKGACEQGECGSCSVQIDGQLVCSCLVLAAASIGRPITTVEGLAARGAPTDVQQAYVDGRCRPVRVLHPRADHGHPRSARPGGRTHRDADPRGAVGQRLPVHRVRTHHRCRPAGGGARRGAPS